VLWTALGATVRTKSETVTALKQLIVWLGILNYWAGKDKERKIKRV